MLIGKRVVIVNRSNVYQWTRILNGTQFLFTRTIDPLRNEIRYTVDSFTTTRWGQQHSLIASSFSPHLVCNTCRMCKIAGCKYYTRCHCDDKCKKCSKCERVSCEIHFLCSCE